MKWRTATVKDRIELEKLLNSLEAEGSIIESVTMDQAHGGFVVIYKIKEVELFND